MKYILIKLIRLYQVMPLSSHTYCRHLPSCSNYMIESLEYYGLFKGLYLGIKRILKCRPGGTYGFDPLIKER